MLPLCPPESSLKCTAYKATLPSEVPPKYSRRNKRKNRHFLFPCQLHVTARFSQLLWAVLIYLLICGLYWVHSPGLYSYLNSITACSKVNSNQSRRLASIFLEKVFFQFSPLFWETYSLCLSTTRPPQQTCQQSRWQAGHIYPVSSPLPPFSPSFATVYWYCSLSRTVICERPSTSTWSMF